MKRHHCCRVPTRKQPCHGGEDIVDAMYNNEADNMHASGLRLDENYIGDPTDLQMWRMIHKTSHSIQWNCPMHCSVAVCQVSSELWRHRIPCDWIRLGVTTRTATPAPSCLHVGRMKLKAGFGSEDNFCLLRRMTAMIQVKNAAIIRWAPAQYETHITQMMSTGLEKL